MKHKTWLVFWELILLLASILVFRSVWILLDQADWANSPAGIVTLLIVGLFLTVKALVSINKDH